MFNLTPVEVIEGTVEKIDNVSFFFARLQFNGSEEVSIARIRYDQIPSRYHKKIVLGARFIWFTGLLRTATDSTMIDVINFNDEVWTKKEIEAIEEKAEELSAFFTEDLNPGCGAASSSEADNG